MNAMAAICSGKINIFLSIDRSVRSNDLHYYYEIKNIKMSKESLLNLRFPNRTIAQFLFVAWKKIVLN